MPTDVTRARCTHWVVESTADCAMTENIAIAKADAASDWVRAVNAAQASQPRRAHSLCSETAIRSVSDWRYLLAASRTHRRSAPKTISI